MKFRYKKYGPGVLRPVISLTLKYESKSINYEALVDSGADECIFDAQIGALLGMDVTSGTQKLVAGITGVREPYFDHALTLVVGGYEYQITVGFLPGISRLGYGVLGQKGFFDIFIVKFDYLKEEIELKERK